MHVNACLVPLHCSCNLVQAKFKHIVDQTSSFAHVYNQISNALAIQLTHMTPLDASIVLLQMLYTRHRYA